MNYKEYAEKLNEIIRSNNNRKLIVCNNTIKFNTEFIGDALGITLIYSDDYCGMKQHHMVCGENNRKNTEVVENYDFLTIPNIISLCLDLDINIKDKYHILANMIIRSV